MSIKATRTLNVKKTTNEELALKWKLAVRFTGDLYIRCNAHGNVNWEKASVYKASELVERDKVNIID